MILITLGSFWTNSPRALQSTTKEAPEKFAHTAFRSTFLILLERSVSGLASPSAGGAAGSEPVVLSPVGAGLWSLRPGPLVGGGVKQVHRQLKVKHVRKT